MSEEPLLVDWKTLKKKGWPYSRQHTYRLIKAGKFPEPKKFSNFRGGRVAWLWSLVKHFFE